LARAHGVGMGWISILEPHEVRRIVDVPVAWQLIAYLCLGYPQQEQDRPELEQQGWEKRHAYETVRLNR
jgi:5,6-dimethylbenzimidazole synthase